MNDSQTTVTESNVMSHIAHQLTQEGPARRTPALGLPSVVHFMFEGSGLFDCDDQH